jgi:hypothetical protein
MAWDDPEHQRVSTLLSKLGLAAYGDLLREEGYIFVADLLEATADELDPLLSRTVQSLLAQLSRTPVDANAVKVEPASEGEGGLSECASSPVLSLFTDSDPDPDSDADESAVNTDAVMAETAAVRAVGSWPTFGKGVNFSDLFSEYSRGECPCIFAASNAHPIQVGP